MTVKGNPGVLYQDVALFFDPPTAAPPWLRRDLHETRTLDDGHRRTLELRTLTASTDLNAYLGWPHLAQVLWIERTWREQRTTKRCVDYAITSLAPDRADADVLLRLKRDHWRIENRLHWCKDVVLGEDASPIHAGQGPRVLSLLRDLALNLLRLAGVTQISATRRASSRHPERAWRASCNPALAHKP